MGRSNHGAKPIAPPIIAKFKKIGAAAGAANLFSAFKIPIDQATTETNIR